MHKTSIVIADDHHLLRQGVRSMLAAKEDWHIVAEAADGQEALQAIVEYRPDIAVIDFFMPFMNGLELTRAIRHESPGTKVLIFTMLNEESVVRDLLVAGANGIVFKFDPGDRIVDAVRALSRHRPYYSESISETLLAKHRSQRVNGRGMLTDRQRKVVQHIAEGMISKEISSAMGISLKTVETHRASVMQKLSLKSIADLVRYAVRNHIIEA